MSQRVLQFGYEFVFKSEAIVYHQNENSFKGLFKEGFAHGFYSIQALKKHRGKRKDAALDLGISERTLYRKLKEYDIDE